MLRGFIALRVIVITTLLLSALLIQLTFDINLPLEPIYYLAAFSYGTSMLALFTLRRVPGEAHAGMQIVGDLAVITGIVFLSRGPDSGFTFLYVGSITAGAVLLGRRGGIITAALASVFYSVLVYLMHVNALPTYEAVDIPVRVLSPGMVVSNIALNIAAFFATGFLVSIASQKLRETQTDLERRKNEMARLQSLHAAVLASMSSGVATTDLLGGVTYANPPALEMLGVPWREILGRHITTLGLVDRDSWQLVKSSTVEILRFEGLRPALGEGAYFGISATALRDGEGRITGRIFIFQNLTELKQLEGEVRLKEKMAAVGELAAGIAHEIRNPLASISGSVQVLRGAAVPGSSEQRLMEIVVSESQRLSSIIEDFLRYVRPRERAVEGVDAPAALRDVMTLLSHSEEFGKHHRLELDLQPPSLIIPADPGQLRQIFWNLARNALAAMPGGGTLAVRSRAQGEKFVFTVHDEGHGMSREEMDRLFTPFAHSFPGGTGLGLAIVYRIVEEHGGSIRVESSVGGGTAIAISMPLEDTVRRRSGAHLEPVSRAALSTAVEREVA